MTTGRKRRCGWLDLVVVKYSTGINHYTSLNITKLDILDDFPELKIATGYSYKGEKLASFPADLLVLADVDVEYESFPGWQKPTSECRSFNELPAGAQRYLRFIEDKLEVPVAIVSVGQKRDQTIIIEDPIHGPKRVLTKAQ